MRESTVMGQEKTGVGVFTVRGAEGKEREKRECSGSNYCERVALNKFWAKLLRFLSVVCDVRRRMRRRRGLYRVTLRSRF